MNNQENSLRLKYLGINTYKEAVIYMHKKCHVCKSEGFEAQARVKVTLGAKSIQATLHMVDNSILTPNEASLSIYAWQLLGAKEGEYITLSHQKPLPSLAYVRAKVYGNTLGAEEIQKIIDDVTQGYYSDIHIATFLTACAGGRLSQQEIISLTNAMINTGDKLHWPTKIVVDKHSVGGLPGNRTSLIVVPIVAAFGLTMPKTSSRAITSPAGTADTMETLAPVDLDIKAMRKVVEQENGCLVWGGTVTLSPADDILIRVERAMDVDSEGQLIASVLSKKASAGSGHLAIDIPVGPTAKVRSEAMANSLAQLFQVVAHTLGIEVRVNISDGLQPVGRGIGPALEAKDVLSVLQNSADAPKDLRERSLKLASMILEFSPSVAAGQGIVLATELLNSGKAWAKFQAICKAQGGMRQPPTARFTHVITALKSGRVYEIDNRQLARLAKLAGAPLEKAAGIVLHTPINTIVESGQPMFTIHSEAKGQLEYALSLLDPTVEIIKIG